MTDQPLSLVNQLSIQVAVLHVERVDGGFQGTICLDAAPPELKQLFEEFEECVEGQIFSVADEIEQKIDALRLRILFPNGTAALVEDLQVFPSTRLVSFRVQQPLPPPAMTGCEQLVEKVHH